jgi:hypothetical protein
MTITTRPATARTDVRAAGETAAPTISATGVRRVGVAVAAGAGIWSLSMMTVGANPDSSLGITIADAAALPFQLSLFALVTAQLRTSATGTSRAARGMLRVEYALLALASLWTILHGAVPAFRDDAWLAVLDAFWPLSMLGMFIIAVKIAFTGRWKRAGRAWPLVAESWAVVCVPVFGILGPGLAANLVAGGHLLIGYVALGLILALRPQVTGVRS